MADTNKLPEEVGRLINLIPVGLKEAVIDSPTSRATVVHYGEQVDLLERWLEDYMKATLRLVAESSTLENILSNFTSHAIVPTTIGESMLDHDYDVLAMKKYSEGAKDYWMSMVSVVKRLSTMVVEPIKNFLNNDLRAFKEARRTVEMHMRTFDSAHSRYASFAKSKEPSGLREEAFQLHEARKQYLRASMDLFALAPQFRFSLDKLLVKIFYDQWKEMRISRDNTAATFQRGAPEMDRVRGWVTEMETSERTFRRELQTARKQLEDAAEASVRPSRELDDYSSSGVAQYGGHTHTASNAGPARSPSRAISSIAEKQGWLYLRTYASRGTRFVWVKRWAFLRNGVFGWLLQSTRVAGVEESERIGVLLCNVRSAVTEERRFCFELKTNKHTIVLQAETQPELMEWMDAFQTAKSKALEDPGATDTLASSTHMHSDPAFAITHPPVPEFGNLVLGSLEPGSFADDQLPSIDQSHPKDGSADVSRRSTAGEETGHREHTSHRIMSKLDLHRKSATPSSNTPTSPNPAGGIASLIAASHGSMPVGPSVPMVQQETEKPRNIFTLALRDMPPSTLAPSTLANVPAPTSMSKSAVMVTGERGLSAAADKSGIPNSLLANMWGSSTTAFVNRLDRSDPSLVPDGRLGAQPSPLVLPSTSPPKSPFPAQRDLTGAGSMSLLDLGQSQTQAPLHRTRSVSPSKRLRHTMTAEQEYQDKLRRDAPVADFPNYYPLQLKTQDAQFRLLFPVVKRDERLVLVFRATWNPNDQQDFPGRVYVTANNVYFYSNHLGLVLTSTVSLTSVDEATAAPGKECDFLFLHMREGGLDGSTARITVKTFLEPLRLLQRRLNFLIKNSVADEPQDLEEIIKSLLRMEAEVPVRSPSLESWDDQAPDTPTDVAGTNKPRRANIAGSELRTAMRVDRSLNINGLARAETFKFKLPAQAVKYTPPGNLVLAAEREFDVSPKALFHIMFGDKSAMWQLLQHERQARNLKQGPWMNLGEGRLRRDFAFEIPSTTIFGSAYTAEVRDYQNVDVNSDHLCYVVTDKRTPWYLPFQHNYRLVSKVVITHVAKGKCKLAVFVRVEWLRQPWILKGPIDRQALHDLELDALDLTDLVADQVRKLGAHSRTKKAVQIFGQVGQSTETTQLQVDASAHIIEMRRAPVSRTVTGLMADNVASVAQSTLSTAMESMIDFVQWLGKTFSANKIILVVLIASVLYNSWLTSKDTYGWWKERSAARFMTKLGVTSNNVMSKAVYVSDLDELVSASVDMPQDDSVCYSTFWNERVLDDVDSLPLGAPAKGRATQVRKTRQQLGKYRHDLLVAMRVVNSVEKEVARSEWEDWLGEENRRCKRIGGLVDKSNGTSVEGLDEYCRSCADAAQSIRA